MDWWSHNVVSENTCEAHVEWCNANDDSECKLILQECSKYDISLGDFVKAMLKINNICLE